MTIVLEQASVIKTAVSRDIPYIPHGYKHSELGMIPEDWTIAKASDFKPFITSGSRGWARYYSEHGQPFLRITNLSRDSIYPDLANLRYVKLPINNAEASRTSLQNGDILISITADIGIIGYISEEVPKPAYINQHIACLRLPPSKVNSKFQSYFLASHEPQKRFAEITDTGAKLGINLTTVGQLTLLCPSLPEQNAIAEALSDVDALIDELEQLIAKKRQIKQGAMQELLTGKRRLSGFRGKWETRRLGDIVTFQRGFDLPHRLRRFGSIPVVTSSGIESTHSEAKVKGPGVVTGRYGTIGEVFFVREDFWPLNTTLYVRSFHGNDPLYVFYFLNTVNFKTHSGKSGVPGVNRNDLHEITVAYPANYAEQKAIAETLSDADALIEGLEQLIAKRRQIKQGMIQELVAGRVRLV